MNNVEQSGTRAWNFLPRGDEPWNVHVGFSVTDERPNFVRMYIGGVTAFVEIDNLKKAVCDLKETVG